MPRLVLYGGAYEARSIIANAQRCVNLYPESNPKDAPVPLTHYQRPGLRKLVQGPRSPVRCLYRASNGNGYAIIGQGVYAVSPTWVLTHLGDLTVYGVTPVSMIDNGTTAWIVDNSAFGYSVNLGTNAFAVVVDGTGTFVGGTQVAYLDTYMLCNTPGTTQFISTTSGALAFDALFFANKTGYPDPINSLAIVKEEIWLLGNLKSEIWANAGAPQFPFSRIPGAAFEHGCVAPYSVATSDVNVFWLGQDLQGQGVVFMGHGYEVKRISTHAVEFAIQGYPAITDAVGFTYQQGGHVFYVLNFTSGDATWVYDAATELWHQRCWTDGNGVLHKDRSNVATFMYSTNVVGDWENGTLYALDPTVYTDTVESVEGPISFIRSFPHIAAMPGPSGQLEPLDGRLVRFDSFAADIQCGEAPLDAAGNPARISLRWSIDRGRTFGNALLQSAGTPGQFLTQPQWSALGIGRDVVFELSYAFAGPAALNGAWVDGQIGVN